MMFGRHQGNWVVFGFALLPWKRYLVMRDRAVMFLRDEQSREALQRNNKNLRTQLASIQRLYQKKLEGK